MASTGAVKVWDLPTRLLHWLMVLLLGASWYTAETGAMDWHYRSGITLLGLIVFRLLWGVIGGSTARFSHFVRGPVAAWAYLRRPAGSPHRPGHNPLGGYSVLLLLLVLAAQIGTGLFTVDVDGIESGPLSYMVSFDQGRAAAEVHEKLFDILLVLAALHVLAILYYWVRGRKLLVPMVTGRDPQITETSEALAPAGAIRLVLALILSAAVAWYVSKGLTF